MHVLVGGGVALPIGQILIPLDPLAQVGRIARPVLRELGTVLVSVAEVRRLHEALAVGQETARFAPLRRGRARPPRRSTWRSATRGARPRRRQPAGCWRPVPPTRAMAVLDDPAVLWTAMVVGQVRSTAVDLLRGSAWT